MSAPQLHLRPTTPDDLDTIFRFQCDPDSNFMAGFTSEDPNDRAAFDAKWQSHFERDDLLLYTAEQEGLIIGNLQQFPLFGEINISYWIDRPHWGKGLASAALREFLKISKQRPLTGRIAFDNQGSRRVLERNGFQLIREEKAFANARGKEIIEYVFQLS